MAERKVTQSGKDRDGDITALCNPGQSWSPRSKRDAISDIENETHSYYVDVGGKKTQVLVRKRNGVKYLTTAADDSKTNNLDNLPNC